MENKDLKLDALQEKLGYFFKNKDLLITALTHKSYANEHDSKIQSNEKLEFLGDAVLDIVTTEYLYNEFPDKSEGMLTKIQSYIVSTDVFYNIALDLDLGEHMRLSKGEQNETLKKKIGCDAFEAIIAGIYLDGGIKEAKRVIIKFLKDLIDAHHDPSFVRDDKSELQEYMQLKYKTVPQYITEREKGPAHNKYFDVSVYINDKKIASGSAKTKKEAEKQAARKALIKLKKG